MNSSVEKDLQIKAFEKLKEKTNHAPCSECGNTEWFGDIYRLPDESADMVCYRSICRKCGYIRFFNLGDLLS